MVRCISAGDKPPDACFQWRAGALVPLEKTPWRSVVRRSAKWRVAERKVVRLVTVPDFLCELRAGCDATQQKQGESYHTLIERYQTRDVLVFDDLGAEKLTDWVEEQLSLLVDYRYRQWLPVLASSNCPKEALEQWLTRRGLDQLRETSTMVEVKGSNQWDRSVQFSPL